MIRQTLVVISAIALLAVLTGCSTCEPVAPLFVQGSVRAQIDQSGVLVKSTAREPVTTIELRKPGESRCVPANEPFDLSIPDAIDMAKYALQISECETPMVTAGSPNFQITLVESCMPILVLKQECKILNWYNPYRIPEIRVTNDSLSQLVLTPLLSDDNEIIGYEVRLGDHRECGSPALKVLEAFRKGGGKVITVKSNTKKTPRSLGMLCRNKKRIG
jgi:hypothetical protein